VRAKPATLPYRWAWGVGISLTLLFCAETAILTAQGGQSVTRTGQRDRDRILSQSPRQQTAYETLLRMRRQRRATGIPEPDPDLTGPVVARAELRLVRPLRDSPTHYLGLQRQDTTPVRPPQLREVPADAPKEPAYFTVRVGNRDVPGVTYRSTHPSRRIKLCLDTDGDGLLSDEKEYVGTWLSLFRLSRTFQFGPVVLRQDEIRAGGDVFYAQCSNGRSLNFYPAFYREGEVLLNGKAYKIALIDHDFDGLFNESFVPPAEDGRDPGCDVFAMDLDGDSKFDLGEAGESEIMPLSRLVRVNETYYGIHVAEDGSSVEFSRVTPQFGMLDFGDQDVDLRLWSDTAHLRLTGPGAKWRVPAGKYGVVSLELTETDSAGKQWTFRSSKASTKTPKLAAFEVRPGESVSFRVGPPFQIRTSMRQSGANVLVGFELEGQAGELYKPGGEKAGTAVPEPEFKIIDASQRVVDSGRFKYG
jgi:hypothetical protein